MTDGNRPGLQITVRCFSHLRHHLGREQLLIELPVASTTADVERQVRQMLAPAIRDMRFRIALNRQFVDQPQALSNGDELALLPPMQGG